MFVFPQRSASRPFRDSMLFCLVGVACLVLSAG